MSHQFLSKPPPGAQLNFAHPLTRGLVGCWLMNEPGWRAYDCSPYKNHGTLSGFDSPPRRNNQGIVFDGVNDLVTVTASPSLDIEGNNQITIELWLNGTTGSGANNRILYKERWINDVDKGGYVIQQTDITGATYFTIINNGVINSGGTIIADQWNHFVGTYDGSVQRVYINGILVDQDNNAAGIGTHPAANLRFGGTNGYWNGQLSLVRIWNRALNSGDIKSLYSSPYSMFIGQ